MEIYCKEMGLLLSLRVLLKCLIHKKKKINEVIKIQMVECD